MSAGVTVPSKNVLRNPAHEGNNRDTGKVLIRKSQTYPTGPHWGEAGHLNMSQTKNKHTKNLRIK